MKEVEILTEVKSSKEDALKALRKYTSHGIKRTLDIYFVDPLRQDLQPDEDGHLRSAFRIRMKQERCYMAYKVDHFDENDSWTYSDEHETEVADFETSLRVVELLGLKELIRIDNEKHVFTTPEYEIVFEDVKDLGHYLEVEKLGHVEDGQVETVKEAIRAFMGLTEITFGNECGVGKPELMLARNKQLK